MTTYTVSGVKSFIGREGHGFNAYLHADGRKIAFVTDHANGGTFSFDWLAKDRAQANAEETALDNHVNTLPQVDLGHGHVVPQDRDGFLAQLVEREENRRRFKRLLANRILFVQDGQCRQTPPVKLSAAMLTAAAQKWPTATILNSLPFDTAFDLFLRHSA